jgi:hypothetical protein
VVVQLPQANLLILLSKFVALAAARFQPVPHVLKQQLIQLQPTAFNVVQMAYMFQRPTNYPVLHVIIHSLHLAQNAPPMQQTEVQHVFNVVQMA